MALAEDPGHSGEPTALHQVSARWHRINAELQMRVNAADVQQTRAHRRCIVERHDVAATFHPSSEPVTGFSEEVRGWNAENKRARLFRTA